MAKMILKISLIALSISLFSTSFFLKNTIAAPLEVFVSPSGTDSNPGTFEKPLATLEKARDTVRLIKEKGEFPSEGIRVVLRGGTYRLNSTFTLGAPDSGTSGGPVVYTAYGNETVTLSGGEQIDFNRFVVLADEGLLSRLPADARGKVYVCDLTGLDMASVGEPSLIGHSMEYLDAVTPFKSGVPDPELFIDGEAMQIARWPNGEWARVGAVVEVGSVPRDWMDDVKNRGQGVYAPPVGMGGYVPPEKRDNPPKGFTIKLDDKRISNWTHAEDAMLFGYWRWDWSDQSVRVRAVDPQSGTISSVQPSAYGVRAGQRFYVYNLLEEIDEPGEWYLDRQRGLLFLYPPQAIIANGGKVEISLLSEPLVRVANASYITFERLSFSVGRGDGIRVFDSNHIVIDDCTLGQFGGTAVKFYGGKNSGIRNSLITSTGAGGVVLQAGDRKTLEPAGLFVENCDISGFSRVARTYTPGVHISGVGNRVHGSRIHDAVHAAIIFAGNDHLIDGNEIFAVCQEADDMGAIYAGRDATARGTVISNNHIHDIRTNSRHRNGVHALFLDDLYSGTFFKGNTVEGVDGMGVLINGGRDNRVEGNVFSDMKAAVSISDMGRDPRFGYKDEHSAPPMARGVDYRSAPYQKYANLATLLEDEPRQPKYNQVSGNRVSGTRLFHYWPFQTGNTEETIRQMNRITDDGEIVGGGQR